MAAIAVTAIELGSDAKVSLVRFAEAVVLGAAVYMDTTASNKWRNADANAGIAQAGRDGIAIALHAVSGDNRYGVVVESGTVYIQTLGASGEGGNYVVGDTAGAIHPEADAASGWYKTTLGTGGTIVSTTTPNEFVMKPIVSNQLIP